MDEELTAIAALQLRIDELDYKANRYKNEWNTCAKALESSIVYERDTTARLRAELAQRDALIAAFEAWVEQDLEAANIALGVNRCEWNGAASNACRSTLVQWNELKAQYLGNQAEVINND